MICPAIYNILKCRYSLWKKYRICGTSCIVVSVAGGIVGALRRILRIVTVALFVPTGHTPQCPPVIRTLLRLDHNSFRDARDVPGDLDQGVWLLREEHLTHLTRATRTDGQDSTLGKAKSLLFATDTGRKMLEMLVMIQAQVPMARGTYSIGEDV